MKGTTMEEASHNQPVTQEKKRGSGGPIVAILAILVILGLGLAFVSGKKGTTPQSAAPVATDSDGDTDGDKMMMASPSTSAVASSSASPVVEADETIATDIVTINLEAGSFYYKPNTITVKKGQKVKLVMKSADMMHDFNIDELGVKLPITKSGETNTVEFTADKVGTFEYYCSVGQHRAKGQVGKITIQ